jgi:hemolysin III
MVFMDAVMKTFRIKEPGSAITHFTGFCLTAVGAAPLILKSLKAGDLLHPASMAVFLFTMLLLYAASTLCHSLDISEDSSRRLRKFDHMSIYVLIAGTYTPVCLIGLHGTEGNLLCICVWTLAAAGCAAYYLWVDCPKWLSSALYIAMGWLIIFKIRDIAAISPAVLALLFGGGVLYTVGGCIYALKCPAFNSRHKNFGTHEIFHLFVMAGSLCHYLLMYLFLANLPV